jgi:hypothetical protein
MAYCPNCNGKIDEAAIECPKCQALFDEGAVWRPTGTPSALPRKASALYLIGRALVWGGHFLLFCVPVLFILYHLLLYRGGGTSGVPLAYSMMFSPYLYIPGYVLAFLGRDKAL